MIKISCLGSAILLFALYSASCSVGVRPNANNSGDRSSDRPTEVNVNKTTSANEANKPGTNAENSTIRSGGCKSLKLPGKKLIESQTFVFDHEPFKGSCFATFGSVEDMVDEKDVPRGSTFHIFTDGKEVFEFPDAFGGISSCWVDALSFDDLNGDGQVDVVMKGSCLAAKDSYPSNAVFVNNGRGFTTNDEANSELDELRSIGEIRSYVKKNTNKFFE